MNDNQFENQAYALFNAKFDTNKWPQFANYLITHPANPTYHNNNNKYNAQTLTWVLVMRLMRNIIAHEHQLKWQGLMATLGEVLQFTKSRENFRELIQIYENFIIP